MFTLDRHLFLASASPRRHALLNSLDLQFSTLHLGEVEPIPKPDEIPAEFVRRSARAKGEAAILKACGQGFTNFLILAADTIVYKDLAIMGKPKDASEALHMLQELSGGTHSVSTAVYLSWDLDDYILKDNFTVTTTVTFFPWTDSILENYVRTGEPMDKAGAYAIQGKGAFLAKSVNGSWTNVVGLPLSTLVKKLLHLKLLKQDS